MNKYMMTGIRSLILALLSILTAESAWAQLTTTNLSAAGSPADIANSLVGPGVTIHNVSFTGTGNSAGLFAGGSGIIGFDAGVVLSSGEINNVVGPNTAPDTTTVLGSPGDPDLNVLSGKMTYDATVLEFDFIPQGDTVTFQYVFASEEYNEYVNTEFNDAFAFLIGSGTNIFNCALVGDPPAPVSINTVNNGPANDGLDSSNSVFFVNNDDGVLNTEMDGLTVVLTCEAPVIPLATNHIKMAIADATDTTYDSCVFIEQGSFTSPPPEPPEPPEPPPEGELGDWCPRTQGFWKTHEEEWPVDSLVLGSILYEMDDLMALLERSTKGDASVALAKQLIAAKLNVAKGAEEDPVAEAFELADLLIGSAALPMEVHARTRLGQDMEFVKSYLDDYNNGRFTDCQETELDKDPGGKKGNKPAVGPGNGKGQDNGNGKKK